MPPGYALAAGLVTTLLLVSCGGGGGGSSASAPSLDGTTWSLTDVGGSTAHPGGMLSFKGGKLSGSTGCNTFGGTYEQSGSSLTVTLGPTTLIGCPPPLDEQEQAVLAALPKITSFAGAGRTLTLLDDSGTTLLGYAHQQAGALVGPTWAVTGINNGRGAVQSVIAGSTVTLAFGEDGSASGSAGCNTFTASYTLDGQALHVGPPASTRKHCESPPGVMDQEAAFLAALERATTLEPSTGGYTLRAADGATQLILAPPG